MYDILTKTRLNETVVQMDVYAPLVAAKAQPGQFIILRASDTGERIPLTVAGTDPKAGSVRIIFQTVGATTMALGALNVGDAVCDFVGPLGEPTRLDGLKKVCVVAGGVGSAIALPIARALRGRGADVTSVLGFRTGGLVILKEDFDASSSRTYLATDDGSAGEKGNVCDVLTRLLDAGERFDRVFAVGPLVMMKYTVAALRPYGVPCTVSMNPIMIDGTGMCGGCRLSLTDENGKKKTCFACMDGPDFDGYQVDFDEVINRNNLYKEQEGRAREKACRLLQKEVR